MLIIHQPLLMMAEQRTIVEDQLFCLRRYGSATHDSYDRAHEKCLAIEGFLRVCLSNKGAWLHMAHETIIPPEWLSMVATSV
jgi:hypothetical protein